MRYPNPAENVVFVRCTDEDITQYTLVDSKERELLLFNIKSGSQGKDISNFESGVYVILAKDRNAIIINEARWVKF